MSTVTEMTANRDGPPHPPLTRDERRLLASVNRHLRAGGWTWQWRGLVNADGTVDVDWWSHHYGDRTTLQITDLRGSRDGLTCSAEVRGVRQAVDVAVAYGLLPAEFSSAYRAALDTPRYTPPLVLRADQLDAGWLLLDASDETRWHPVTAVLECEAECPIEPFVGEHGPRSGYVAGWCGHAVAESEWRAGFRVCEHCPDAGDCVVVVSAAFRDGEAHLSPHFDVNVRIPAGEL